MAGMTVLLLLLWAGVTVSSPVDLQKRVVGGKTCHKDERKYHVYVQGYNGTHYFKCGGSLIHERWVLTAAHCYQGEIDLFLGVHPGPLNLKSGGKRWTDHKIYTNSGQPHDLMLVKFTPDSSVNITTIKLPTKAECDKSDQIPTVEVAGYGGIDKPSTLQCGIFVKISSAKEVEGIKTLIRNCNDPIVKAYTYENIIYYTHGPTFTAGGDSGGGVVHKKKLYGVHVLDHEKTQSCFNKRGIAMDLCNEVYRKWIKDHTGIQLD